MGLTVNNNFMADDLSIVYSDIDIAEGDSYYHPKKIDIEIQTKAFHIIQNQIMPIRSAFILVNEQNQAFIASSMGTDIKHRFFTKVLSLIDDNESKVPLFYKSSELKNIKVMSEEDYLKQSVLKQVIPEDKCHFVDIDDICNQVLKETNMKHLILILELHRGQDYVITSNTLEKDFAIALTKGKLINERYTRIVLTEEIDAIYKERMQKEIQVFEIPEREYPISEAQKIWYKKNPSKNPRQLYFAGMILEKTEEEPTFWNHDMNKIKQNYENSNAHIYQDLNSYQYMNMFVYISIMDAENYSNEIRNGNMKLQEYYNDINNMNRKYVDQFIESNQDSVNAFIESLGE